MNTNQTRTVSDLSSNASTSTHLTPDDSNSPTSANLTDEKERRLAELLN